MDRSTLPRALGKKEGHQHGSRRVFALRSTGYQRGLCTSHHLTHLLPTPYYFESSSVITVFNICIKDCNTYIKGKGIWLFDVTFRVLSSAGSRKPIKLTWAIKGIYWLMSLKHHRQMVSGQGWSSDSMVSLQTWFLPFYWLCLCSGCLQTKSDSPHGPKIVVSGFWGFCHTQKRKESQQTCVSASSKGSYLGHMPVIVTRRMEWTDWLSLGHMIHIYS